VVQICLENLRGFIEHRDQNCGPARKPAPAEDSDADSCAHAVKYLGLLGLHKLMKQQPRAVYEHKDLILDCLSDDDVTIRMRALDLVNSLVSQRNLRPIVERLLNHLSVAEGSYRVGPGAVRRCAACG
jgi:AP-3 complex subunit delta-1